MNSQKNDISKPIKALALSSLLSLVFMLTRILLTANISYIFLSWNLFLAWVPLILAMIIDRARRYPGGFFKIALLPLFALWLLFFPNAPYIVTDLVHIEYQPGSRYWFDLVLIYLFAFTGLSAGMMSLYRIHQTIREMFGSFPGWLMVIGSSVLAGYGVYLGRILRWNSWDLFTNTRQVLQDTTLQIYDPTAQAITIVFGLLLFCTYFLFISLLQYKHKTYGRIQN